VQGRIAVGINPVRRLRRHMTGLAVLLVVLGCGLLGVGCIEPGPTPAVAPKLVFREPADVVSHHDEPTYEGAGTAYGSRRHRFGGCLVHFLHENSTIGIMPGLAVCGDGSG